MTELQQMAVKQIGRIAEKAKKIDLDQKLETMPFIQKAVELDTDLNLIIEWVDALRGEDEEDS